MSKRIITSLVAILSILVLASCIFRNKPQSSNGAVSVAIPDGKKLNLPENFFGFNTQMIHGPGWENQAFLESVKKLHPQNLRYPGGTIANYWDWKKGWFFESETVPAKYRKTKPVSVTLESFKKAIDATGAKPVFVLNMITSDINYQVEMLQHAQKIGLEIKYIELGNEFYGKEEASIKKYPTGKDYGTDANAWIKTIKKEFPSVRIAVVGCGKTDVPGTGNQGGDPAANRERVANWDTDLFSVIKNADAVTYHIYPGPGVPSARKTPGNAQQKNSANKQQQVTDDLSEKVQMSLGMPFAKIQQIKQYNSSSVPAGLKIWYTEYNMFEKNVAVSGTWDHGLYVSAMTLLFLKDELTELICNHNITKNARFAAIFNDENGFDEYLKKDKTKQFGFSAGGLCLSLLGEAMAEKNQYQFLNFTNAKSFKTVKQVTYQSLFGCKFSGAKGESIVVFNFSPENANIDLKQVAGKNMSYVIYSDNPTKQVADDATVNSKKGALNGQLEMPPYSIVLVR